MNQWKVLNEFNEWNEWNENTCFMPSVYKGSGYRRMIRYYQSLFDGKKL